MNRRLPTDTRHGPVIAHAAVISVFTMILGYKERFSARSDALRAGLRFVRAYMHLPSLSWAERPLVQHRMDLSYSRDLVMLRT